MPERVSQETLSHPDAPVNIARCPEHGLHGEREECFVCGGAVDQVAMVALADYEALRRRVEELQEEVGDATVAQLGIETEARVAAEARADQLAAALTRIGEGNDDSAIFARRVLALAGVEKEVPGG